VSEGPEATVPLAPAARTRAYRRFAIEVVDGPDVRTVATASGEEIGVGTAEGNELRLSDETVSRHHLSATMVEGRLVVRDLGSMNGIRLAGHHIEVARLRDGASFRVGRTKLRFRLLDGEISEPLSEAERFGRAIGRSDAMRRIFALLERVAPSDTTLLLEGETGTGKGLLVEAIHEASARSSGPLVVIDCGSIPALLIESELFGHEKGAFTGAQGDRAGAFEAAMGGTVFLDEIGELPLDLQPRLLRALEEKTIKRVGSNRHVALDVRVIAATHRDLRAEVNNGSFRADLFYRLNIVRLRVPPLRERPSDIRLLVRHFHEQFSPDDPMPPTALVEALERQPWLGNVRELRSAVERAVLLGEVALDLDDAPGPAPEGNAVRFDPSVPFRAAKERVVSRWEQAYLSDLLAQAEGNVSKAARLARMDRNHLRELLRRHGLGR
jgi:two-component system, NtrC family, response regulator GlrR